MLARLSVENYVLIEKLDMELSPGLNIVTGETGAGKSILLGALGLILGGRADAAALKDNGRNCVVEGSFELSGYGLEEFFAANDLDYDHSTVVRRVITPAGKSRAYVNDLPVQLTTLKELSHKLIDIHSQHQTRMVSDEGFRTAMADSVAANGGLLREYAAVYHSMRTAERELVRLREDVERERRDEDYLRHQHDRIAALKLKEGEQDELEAEQKELANAEQILTSLGYAEDLLDRDEAGALSQLKNAQQSLQHIGQVYQGGKEFAERINGIFVELKDITAEVSRERSRVEYNPARLSEVDERLGSIYALQQKHGVASVEDLIALQSGFAAKLEAITGSGEHIAELEAEAAKLRGKALAVAAEITESRMAAAVKLTAGVEEILGRLGMPAARFACEVRPSGELSPSGADEIDFIFSANNKGAMLPLEKVASGGETSRVMLALKSLMARGAKLPTIVFDEIDTGVSGRIADATGEIIAELGGVMQVMNITHLPQVASKGDTHFLVYKEDSRDGTKTHIRRLTPAERVEEIAKMLSGSSVTQAAVQQAETLLAGNRK